MRVPIWDDPTKGLTPAPSHAGVAPRATALDIGKLRSQLRGHDLGLDAQLSEQGSPRGRKGLAHKLRTLTSSVYSAADLPAMHTRVGHVASDTPIVGINGGMQRGVRHNLRLSKSMPTGGMHIPRDTESIDGPTVAAATNAEDETGTAPPSRRTPAAPKRRVRVPWERDVRCDPMARFFAAPNIDHLLHAEEI
jgi:hypothetical protein